VLSITSATLCPGCTLARRKRRARVDAGDVGMGMRRAHDSGMELIGEFEIVEKAALPPQQARILAS
jgi:hypothetical protein